MMGWRNHREQQGGRFLVRRVSSGDEAGEACENHQRLVHHDGDMRVTMETCVS